MIVAIETRYAGCRFRSRLEARWAVFFDQLGITWEYEPEGYATSVGNYLPDFRIHVPDDYYPYWFEVKPPDSLVDDRHRVLCVETAMPMIVARGMPRNYGDQLRGRASALTAMLWGDYPTGAQIPAGETQPMIFPAAFVGDKNCRYGPYGGPYGDRGMWDAIHEARPYTCAEFLKVHVALQMFPEEPDQMKQVHVPHTCDDVDIAYEIARSARFEYGEALR